MYQYIKYDLSFFKIKICKGTKFISHSTFFKMNRISQKRKFNVLDFFFIFWDSDLHNAKSFKDISFVCTRNRDDVQYLSMIDKKSVVMLI